MINVFLEKNNDKINGLVKEFNCIDRFNEMYVLSDNGGICGVICVNYVANTAEINSINILDKFNTLAMFFIRSVLYALNKTKVINVLKVALNGNADFIKILNDVNFKEKNYCYTCNSGEINFSCDCK